jgi:hypothetical protein
VALRPSWSSGQAGRIEGDVTALRDAVYEYVMAEGGQTVPAGGSAGQPIAVGSVASIPAWLSPHVQNRSTLSGPAGIGCSLDLGKVYGGSTSPAVFEA